MTKSLLVKVVIFSIKNGDSIVPLNYQRVYTHMKFDAMCLSFLWEYPVKEHMWCSAHSRSGGGADGFESGNLGQEIERRKTVPFWFAN